MATTQDLEERVRAATFESIRQRQAVHGEVLPVEVIQRPVVVDGEPVAIFVAARGIHKPRQLDAALAVTTAPPKASGHAPYDDGVGPDGILRYHYRDPAQGTRRAQLAAERDNEAVRVAMRRRLPIVYWFGVVSGQYLPFRYTFVVDDDPERREFSLDLTGLRTGTIDDIAAELPGRRYQAVSVQARMHQARFRQTVLRAYHTACAVCRLRRAELVDAAHIVGDAEGGQPVVQNGLALCRLHHAAFDRHILGVRPDLRVVIRRDVLEQIDGPMLEHGLRGFHDQQLLVLPTRRADRPSGEFLERRWEQFRTAG